jgi:hypothetical protein
VLRRRRHQLEEPTMSLTPDGHLQMFTIHHRPEDLPHVEYVVRAYVILGGTDPEVGPIVGLASTLGEARGLIPEGADTCIVRAPNDPPQIVESWL